MYKVREGIISRDIGKIYFLIDIHEKDYYVVKKMYSINEMGKCMFDIMASKETFSAEDILEDLIKKLTNYDETLKEEIKSDINKYIIELLDLGYVIEVK